MASSSILDIESLLLPISEEHPSGTDVRYTMHDLIREARREDENLPQGDWKPKGPPKMADWGKVIELAATVLSTESKDLQVAAWLLEALVKRNGFAGLRDGLRLLRELHTRFWDTVYPVVEGGDMEFRAAPVEWLNEKEKSPFFPITVKKIPVLHAHDGVAYSFFHWEESRAVENLGRQSQQAKEEAVAEGKVTKELMDKAEVATPLSHCITLFEDVCQCWDEAQAFDQVLKEKFGEQNSDRPSLENLKAEIESCRLFLDETVQRKGGAGMSNMESRASQNIGAQIDTDTVNRVTAVQGSGGIEPVDRLDALRRLAAVAEFFRKTEPHSPVAYLVQRAAKWGEMPLEEWLNEVIKSEDVLGSVRETLGLKDDKPEE